MDDLKFIIIMSTVCIRTIHYSLGHELVCIHCCSKDQLVTKPGYYSQYSDCSSKPPIKKQTSRLANVSTRECF